MPLTTTQLEAENLALRLQIKKFEEQIAALEDWIKQNETEIVKADPHYCTLCMGECRG